MTAILVKVFTFCFDTRLGRYVLGTLAGLALVVSFVGHQRNIGAARERAVIQEKANDNVRKADDVRRRARDPGARGVRDPYARD